MLPTDTAYVCKNMYIWNTQKTQEYQICEMCVFSAVVVVLLRPYFFAELVGNVNTEKKKNKERLIPVLGKSARLGQFHCKPESWQHSVSSEFQGRVHDSHIHQQRSGPTRAPHLVLALQVTAKQPADKTQKLLYSIEHKMPVLITSSFIRNQYRSEDTQPKSAINISSVHVK